MLKPHALVLLISLFAATTASASTYEAQAYSDTNSDDITQAGFFLRWNGESGGSTLDGQVWEYGLTASLINGAGADYDYLGRRLALDATWKPFETLNVGVAGGIHQLQNVYELNEQGQTLIPLEWSIWLHPREALSFSLKLQRDYVYDDTLFQPAGVLSQLKAWSILSENEIYLTDNLRTDLKGGWRFFSDSDQGRSLDAAIFWEFEVGSAKLAAGVGSETISFRSPSSEYWAPGLYQSVGPRIEATIPFHRLVALTGDAQVYRFIQDLLPLEDRTFVANGVYTHLDLRVGQEEDLNLHLIYELNASGQEQETWTRQRLALTAMATF